MFILLYTELSILWTKQLQNIASCSQGIIDMNRNGNPAIFFSYVCNGKKIKELFASTLDRNPISVRCVSSMIAVSNAKFARLLAQTKRR